MAKKSKASSVSWRTLMRRARLADAKGHNSAAKRLRTMASNIRHGKVTAKPKKKAKARSSRSEPRVGVMLTTIDPRATAGLSVGIADDEAANSNYNPRGLSSQAPGQGEIVGGFDDVMTEKLMRLARQKGGDVLVKTEIMQMQAKARYEGECKRDAAAVKMLKEVQRTTDERIVCSLMAEISAAMQMTGGVLIPGEVWQINSFTLTKVYDALAGAGYTPKGMR